MSTILLVDDHVYFRRSLRRFLEAALPIETHFLEASDGAEALNLVQSTPPDLVLMDCQMPALVGSEACRFIKREHPQGKVILFSAFEVELDLAQRLELADGYVLKTQLLDQICSEIERVMSSPSAMAEVP